MQSFDDCFVFSGSFTSQTGGPFYFLQAYFVKLWQTERTTKRSL